MELSAYKKEALRSETPLTAVRGDEEVIRGALLLAIAAADLIDYVKKVTVYGKEIDYTKMRTLAQAVGDEAGALRHTALLGPTELTELHMNPRIYHAAVGLFGEAGEIMAALLHQANGEGLDNDNIVEEAGDCLWYQGVLLDEIEYSTGVTPDWVCRKNIRKLEIRYPEKFNLEASERRDVVAEAVAMRAVA